MKSSERWPIGDLAAHFGLATHVLRHWESVGLLAPERLANGRRVYGRDQLATVAVILQARQAGLGLPQIRDLLHGGGTARRATLREHRAELARRIEETRRALDLVDHALRCPREDIVACPNFRRMVAGLVDAGATGVVATGAR